MKHGNGNGFTLIELLTVIVIIAILAAILFPVFAAARARAKTSTCLSNLSQIGKALTSYVTDWQETFPTNRQLNANGTVGNLTAEVQLSPLDAAGNQIVERYGLNWVEALYTYTEAASVNPSDQTHWTCPAASTSSHSGTVGLGGTTYALNFNLVESRLPGVSLPGNTMLIREMDRRCGAICRPAVQCLTSDPSTVKAAFLTTNDSGFGSSVVTHPNLHGSGSAILFVDGHVKMFQTTMMPADAGLKWIATDNTNGQWWNSNIPSMKAISICP